MKQLDHAASAGPAYAGRKSEQIIGSSPALKSALAEAERVAPTDATVLVLGETGTGKELFAHAIHNLSPRHERPFIKLDCATIPFDLLDSELFGHEKGAFPWAIAQKIGRLEMADTGTLFLDEIGDLPLPLQPKLLRILQEQEFERPGSGQTRRVNVRLVAATHRNLLEMVRQKEFRSDLYYRLSGFPVILPPLRERRQDISPLVTHFVDIFSRRLGKRIHHIPQETLSAFMSHSWPGNVRELQNLIERAVILSNDGALPNPLPASERSPITVAVPPGAFHASHQSAIGSNNETLSEPLLTSDKHPVTIAPMRGHELGSSDPWAVPPIVFVVSDDVSIRESTEQLILRAGWKPETFASAREFLDRPRPFIPNCLVLDVTLQDPSGPGLQRRIAIERPATPIIFVADHGDVPTSVQAMKGGAVEFLVKPFSDEAILGAIREGLKRSRVALGREAEIRSLRDRYASLTPRERQVMALVASGLLNKQVGAELGISEITVKAHRGQVMHKMKADSLADLVRMASRLRSEHALSSSRSVQPGLLSDPGMNRAVIATDCQREGP
jgi:DNA-binding NtrC family response regulator